MSQANISRHLELLYSLVATGKLCNSWLLLRHCKIYSFLHPSENLRLCFSCLSNLLLKGEEIVLMGGLWLCRQCYQWQGDSYACLRAYAWVPPVWSTPSGTSSHICVTWWSWWLAGATNKLRQLKETDIPWVSLCQRAWEARLSHGVTAAGNLGRLDIFSSWQCTGDCGIA